MPYVMDYIKWNPTIQNLSQCNIFIGIIFFLDNLEIFYKFNLTKQQKTKQNTFKFITKKKVVKIISPKEI